MNSSINSTLSDGGVVKLPKINLPVFDGNIENFLDFWALFENLVHNEANIPKVQKLAYLKKPCTGEPFDRIKNLPLTDSGYDQAVSLMVNEYKDMKSIIRAHFDTLFSINRIKNVKEVSKLLSTIDKALKGLEAVEAYRRKEYETSFSRIK